MLTVFEKISDLFVEMYDDQFKVWGAEYRRRGSRQAIVFWRRPGEVALLDCEGREIVKGAWLEAAVRDGRMVIRPASDRDADLIARHCHEMRSHVLQ